MGYGIRDKESGDWVPGRLGFKVPKGYGALVPQCLNRTRVRAILFDLDGTLVDTDDAHVRRLALLIRPVGALRRDWNEAAFARRLIMAMETPTNALLALLDRLALDEVLGTLLDALHRLRGEVHSEAADLIPGARAALHQLAPHYPFALVSAREQRSMHLLLEALDLASHFQCIVAARTCRRTKPHPAPVLWAAQQLGVQAGECLVVGDTTVDIKAGQRAGAQSVGVLCGFGEREELELAGANLVLESTADLPQVLLDRD